MKIIYGITKGNWGGAQKQVFDLSLAMKEQGHSVGVIFGTQGILKERLEQAGIPVTILPEMQRDVSLPKEINSFLALIKILKQEKPDVIHLHSPKMGAIGGLAARFAGVPKIIYTAHGWPFNEDRPALQKIIIQLISWLTIIYSHNTIVLSAKEKTQVMKWPFVNKKIVVIPNGIKEINFLDRETARNKIKSLVQKNLPENVTWIGTIAELHPNKGLGYALIALNSLPEAHRFAYFVIGEGEERQKLEGENVTLLGFQPDAATLLKAFDLFLLPSVKEGFPYAILEAGMAGLPIIATNVGGIPEIIANNDEGFVVPPQDSEKLKNSIEDALKNPEDMRKKGEVLKNKVLNHYIFKPNFEKILSLYEVSNEK